MGEQKNQASGGWIQTVSNGQIKLQDGMECMCEEKKNVCRKISLLFTRKSKELELKEPNPFPSERNEL